MSYTLTAFAVDLPEIERLVGSKDESVVQGVLDHNAEFFDEEEDEYDDDELFLSEAVRQLVMGEPLDSEDTHQYGYALQELCDTFGELLPCDAWSGVRWGSVEGCGLEGLLTRTGPPVKLPLQSDDFPKVGHLRRGAELATALAAAQSKLETTEGELVELLEEYIGWLEEATETDRDLVFFYS
jgi:hypothetical protein